MTIEILLAALGGIAGAYGGFKRDLLPVAVGVVLLALALIAAWAISG